ncbi:MAG: cytochrome c [Bacteroidota bacterium]
MKKALYFLWPLLILALIMGLRYMRDQDDSQQELGAQLYQTHCATCHMEAGQGLGKLYPPVAGSDFVAARGAELACGIVNGYADTLVVNGVTYSRPMPGIKTLSDYEITQIINHIKTAWGAQGEPVNFKSVQVALEECK